MVMSVNKVQAVKLKQIQFSAVKACEFLKVISNPNRLMLVCEIAAGEKCVSDLEESTQIRQPTLSQQLTILRKKHLVRTRREGKQIYYSMQSDVAISVMNALYGHYCKR